MLALKTDCRHPETQQEYVRTSVGGTNNSPENIAVRPAPRSCVRVVPERLIATGV
jgi:hypothetical protein